MVFFLIATTLLKNDMNFTISEIKNQVLSSTLGTNGEYFDVKLEKEKFKLGNLDSLMFQNDQMIKLDTSLEALLKKIERQYLDIEEIQKHDFQIETREDNYSIEKFIKTFKWDDAKFPRTNPLNEIVKAISQSLYRECIQQKLILDKRPNNIKMLKTYHLNWQKKKETYIQEIQQIFQKQKILNQMILFIQIISIQLLSLYHSNRSRIFLILMREFANMLFPNLQNKDGLTIWRVLICKLPYDQNKQQRNIEENQSQDNKKKTPTTTEQFIQVAREKFKIIVREFEYKENESKERDQKRVEANVKAQTSTQILKQSCQKAFSELYMTYIHLKHLRYIIDINMRFGSQESMSHMLIKPGQGKEKKIIQQFLRLFSDPSSIGLYGTKEELEDTEDFFPFIYVPINQS